MSGSRYFEKRGGGVVRYWTIRRDGIRCHMSWGQVGGRGSSSSMTLDDEAHAERHVRKKIGEKRRQGYVEAEAPGAGVTTAPDADATLFDVMRREKASRYGGWDAYWEGFEPVEGHDGVFAKFYDFAAGPGPFYDYLVLSGDERRGVEFVVKQPGRDPGKVSAFLDFVRPRLGLCFDGRSHHKVPLPAPIGQFDHVLFCGPSLCRNVYAGRLGRVYPIADREICDDDTETWVEARISGRASLPVTTWDRDPVPVADLSFDLRSATGFRELGGNPSVRAEQFKVHPRSELARALRLLPEAVPGSWLKIRNHRREVLTLTPADLTRETPAALDRFLLGEAAGSSATAG